MDKTQYIKFGRYGALGSTLFLPNSEHIQFIDEVRFLGLHFDKDLSWKNHIEHLITKINKYSFLIRNLKDVVPIEVLLNIYYAYVESNLRYGIIIWGVSSHMNGLFIAQKRCVRAIAGVGRLTHCRPIFNELRILTLYDLYVLESVIFLKKYPSLFTNNQTQHCYHTRFKDHLRTTPSCLTKTLNSPSNSIIRIYNKMPLEIKEQLNIHILKKKLKLFLNNSNLYSLSELF